HISMCIRDSGLLGGTLGKQVHRVGAEVGEKQWRFEGSDERRLKRWENRVGEKCRIPGITDTKQLNKFGVGVRELLEGFESKQRRMGICLGMWDLGLLSSQEACLVLTALHPVGNLQKPDEIQAKNVLKIRRRKMKHHQHKRWLKRTKFQRRKRDHFVRVRKQKRFEEDLKEILKKAGLDTFPEGYTIPNIYMKKHHDHKIRRKQSVGSEGVGD
uniref:Small ribosomal subunit protein mS38 n=1 Tax=Eptatretus burgeri TaxID=7764 RepID=A0A8C4Q702_EPTBU